MKKVLLQWLDKIAYEKIKFNIKVSDGILGTYDDSSGQRECYLEYYGYEKPNKKSYPKIFKVKRQLSFENEGDKGKQGATLFILDLNNNLKNIQISEKSAFFNDILILPYKDVKI